MVDGTAESVSVEGAAAVVTGDDRAAVWVRRYLTKYQPMFPQLTAEFVHQNLIVEVQPARAFGIIEREEEFSTRATRWVFPSTGAPGDPPP